MVENALPNDLAEYRQWVLRADGVRPFLRERWEATKPKAARIAQLHEWLVHRYVDSVIAYADAELRSCLKAFGAGQLKGGSQVDRLVADLTHQVDSWRRQQASPTRNRADIARHLPDWTNKLRELQPRKGAGAEPELRAAWARWSEFKKSQLKPKSINSSLSRYFSGAGTLKPLQFAALLHVLKINAQSLYKVHRGGLSIDFSRAAWREGTKAIKSRLWIGSEIRRLIPSAEHRRIDAYARKLVGTEGRHYYVSAGLGVIFILSGRLGVRFLGFDEEQLGAGDALLYEGSYPHAMGALGDSVEVLDVAVNTEGIGREWHYHDFTETLQYLGDDDGSAQWTTRLRTAVALQSSRLTPDHLARLSTIPLSRFEALWTARRTPSEDELREISYLLRTPVRQLFMPRETDPTQLFRVIRKGTFVAKDVDNPITGSAHATYRSGDWRGKTIDAGIQQHGGHRLAFGWLEVDGPRAPDAFANHPGDEEFLYVMEGQLGIAHREQGSWATTAGVLGLGDCAWLRSDLEHTVFAPNGPARALHFFSPAPGRSSTYGANTAGPG